MAIDSLLFKLSHWIVRRRSVTESDSHLVNLSHTRIAVGKFASTYVIMCSTAAESTNFNATSPSDENVLFISSSFRTCWLCRYRYIFHLHTFLAQIRINCRNVKKRGGNGDVKRIETLREEGPTLLMRLRLIFSVVQSWSWLLCPTNILFCLLEEV